MTKTNLPAIEFDATMESIQGLTPILVYVSPDLVSSVAGLLLYFVQQFPTAEHLGIIDSANLVPKDYVIRQRYASVAHDLLAGIVPSGDMSTIEANLNTGSRYFHADLVDGVWVLTLNLPVSTNGIDGISPQLRDSGGYVQVSYDSGVTWVNLIALSEITGPTGPAGSQGIQGVKGDKGDTGTSGADGTSGSNSGTFDNIDPFHTPSGQVICGIADYVATRINNIMSDNITHIQNLGGSALTTFAVADATETAIATGLVDLGIIGVGFAAGAIPIAIAALAAFVLNIGISAINDAFNNAGKTKVIEDLYCSMNGQPTINQSVVDAWKSKISTDLPTIATFINNTIDAVGTQALVKLGGYGALNPKNDCLEYGCSDVIHITYTLGGTGPAAAQIGDTITFVSGSPNSETNYYNFGGYFSKCVSLTYISSTDGSASEADSNDCSGNAQAYSQSHITKIGGNRRDHGWTITYRIDSIG